MVVIFLKVDIVDGFNFFLNNKWPFYIKYIKEVYFRYTYSSSSHTPGLTPVNLQFLNTKKQFNRFMWAGI